MDRYGLLMSATLNVRQSSQGFTESLRKYQQEQHYRYVRGLCRLCRSIGPPEADFCLTNR